MIQVIFILLNNKMCYTFNVLGDIMENYYELLINKIKTALNGNDYQTVRNIIKEELSMPYVPLAIEQKLNDILSQLPPIEDNVTKIEQDSERLRVLLVGNVQKQIQAMEYLAQLNIRNYIDIVKEYLLNDNLPIIKSYLIAICIQQQLNEEITVEKEGYQYQIIPSSLLMPETSDGYILCNERLIALLSDNDPSLLNMSLDVLHQLAYLKLPETYDEDETEILTYSILRYVLKVMNDLNRWEDIKLENRINEEILMDIAI